MFERVFQTEEQKDAEAAEGRSAGQITALRIAASILVANVAVTLALAVVFHITRIPVLQIIIALVLAYYLYKLRPRAEALTLGLALLGAVIQPVLLLMRFPVLTALLEALPTWGTTGALLLLLIGDPSRGRRTTAIALFGVVTVGLYALAIIGRLGR